MPNILEPFRRIFKPVRPLPPGIYHYQAPPQDPRNYRLHLRLEPDGSGILIINASTILHLNQTAAEFAYYLVQNVPAEKVARNISKRYQVKPEQARQDYLDLVERIQTLINTPDLDPVSFLDFERQSPHSGQISAPYRLDCALTYRVPADTKPDVAPIERVERELSTEEWKRIINKAWAAGIPHIVFTGGEPTLREDLVELIAEAEVLGQVSGLLSDGMKCIEQDYLDKLLSTGLDHLMIVLNPYDERSWQAVECALVEDLSVAVHLTLAEDNEVQVRAWLERLARMGVRQVSLSASDVKLAALLAKARDVAASLNLELVWELPVPYSAMHPIALETSEETKLEGAGRAWLYVEPDGDVRPTQGAPQVLGNLLTDPWEKIWKHSR